MNPIEIEGDIRKLEMLGVKMKGNPPLPPAPCSAASSQYLVRWLPEKGGKAVIVGDWHEVITAATLFMESGANKIEIETVREMPPNSDSTTQKH